MENKRTVRSNLGFEEVYESFLDKHKKLAKGDRLRRLEEHGSLEKLLLEKVWWPAFGNFDNLHPEYEVTDFKDGDRFLDYALLVALFKVCIEADGFGTHQKSITRWQFNDERNRQNDLVIDGWIVIRFTYDEITNNPRKCQMKLQQLIGKMVPNIARIGNMPYSFLERAVIKYAIGKVDGLIIPGEIENYMELGKYKVKELLRSLVDKGAFEPVNEGIEGKRVRKYRLILKDASLLYFNI